MAATKYTYSVSTDFTGLSSGYDVPATDKLESEIQTSAIVIALDYIATSGDDCDIWFKDALSAGDETILDGLVAAHDGVPLVSPDNVVLSTPGGVANVDLLLGQARFLRLDNGSFRMNIDGRALGTPVVLWNGTGAGDTGGDWSASGTGSETAGSMHSGTNGWDTGVTVVGNNVRFDNGSMVDLVGSYAELRFWVQPKALPVGSVLRVGWLNGSNQLVGVRLRVDQYVTDLEVDEWQQVSIPIEDFGLTGDVQKLQFRCNNVDGQHYWFDDIEIVPVGNGPFRFRVQAPANERWHVTMLVLVISGDASGWTSTVFANLTTHLDKGLICRQKRLSTGDDLWALNSRDNIDLFGRYHPQDDITFADDKLLVGLMLKPGKASTVITNDDVLDLIVRDDLSGVGAMRAFVHYGAEVIG
jgi:hypothetical protein